MWSPAARRMIRSSTASAVVSNTIRRQSPRSSFCKSKTAAAALAAVGGGGIFAFSSSNKEPSEHTTGTTPMTRRSSSLWSSSRRTMCEFVGMHHMSSSRFSSSNNNNERPLEFMRSTVNKAKTTFQQQLQKSVKARLEETYEIDWTHPIGEGSFGSVYKGMCKKTKQAVAIKKVSLHDDSFQREIAALQYIESYGDHPSICSMRDYYCSVVNVDTIDKKGIARKTTTKKEDEYGYIVLDFVSGGELFDHLCSHGPYSEADAARLIREVSCALSFLHGLNCVHGDLKPENLLLCSDKSSGPHVKIVDFGSSRINRDVTKEEKNYSSPKFLSTVLGASGTVTCSERTIDPSQDMWSVGVTLYILLTGLHPFDLYGDKTEEEIEASIQSGRRPPLQHSPITAHLSSNAIRLLEQLLELDPTKRMTSKELLDHPWVKGDTAPLYKMAGSDKRLAAQYCTYKTKVEQQ